MATHDPRQLLENLRDHLARHDKPIAFLIGAGASNAVRVKRNSTDPEPLIPDTAALTQFCQEGVAALGEKFKDGWEQLVEECKAAGEDANIENLLSRVQLKISALGQSDLLIGLSRDQLNKLDLTIRETISQLAQPEDVPEELPHHKMARWISRTTRRSGIEIFTLNYDILIEQALEDERLPVFDGFIGSKEPFFSPDSLSRQEMAPGVSWVRLWKIHGSVNWINTTRRGQSRIVRTGLGTTGEMILPSLRKYDESRKQPYVALLDRLARFLDQEDALLVTAGYSFRDQHVNEVLFDALDGQGRTHVFALMYQEPGSDSDLLERALRRSRLVVVGPETGVIGTERGTWRLVEPVQDSIADLVDLAFDSDAVEPDDENTVPLTGRIRLGNFIYLSRFLESLSA